MTDRDDWDAAQYTRHSSLQEEMAAQALALIELRGDERVLDVGCGDGRISARIAERVARGSVLGVDASADMIAFAQRHHAALGNLRFMVADARQLSFGERFDAVVSFNALHWVPLQADALRGIRAALAAGGRAWLRLVTQGPVKSLEAIAEDVRQSARWAANFEGFTDPYLRLTPDEYAQLALRQGLQVNSARTQLERWDFGSRDALFGFCNAGFGAWTQRLPQPERTRFVGEVLNQYLAATATGTEEAFVLRFYQTDFALAAASGPLRLALP